MPTYYFDSEIDGDHSTDDEGLVLPDLSAAKKEAVLALYGLASEVDADARAMHASLHVRDQAGVEVLILDMNFTVSAPAGAAG